MADKANIFKELQHHQVDPPEGLFAKIWNKIKKLLPQDSRSSHAQKGIQEEENTPAAEQEPANTFGQLRSYTDAEQLPPAFDYNKLIALLSSEQQLQLQPKKKKHQLVNWLKAAAAVLITAGIGYVLVIHFKQKGNNNSKQGFTQIATLSDKKQSDNQAANGKKGSNKIHVSKHDVELAAGRPAPITRNLHIPIPNGDFIYLLTSFTYEEAQTFLQDIDNKPTLTLNKFSYVNISDKMRDFLQLMYKTNRNNKPTRKARKAQATLNKWKKQDEAFFDQTGNKNPMDIIDLSELLLK